MSARAWRSWGNGGRVSCGGNSSECVIGSAWAVCGSSLGSYPQLMGCDGSADWQLGVGAGCEESGCSLSVREDGLGSASATRGFDVASVFSIAVVGL